MASTASRTVVRSSQCLSLRASRICLSTQPTHLSHGLPTPCLPSLLRPPIAVYCKYGNINPFPIDYAFRPRLRGRLTLPRLTLDRNPWSSGEGGFSPPLSLLMSAFALLIPPAYLHETPSTAYRTLLYHLHISASPQLRCMV